MEHKKWYHLTDFKNTTTWIAMVLIALVATMGSTMENTWYNTYVYNNVTPNTQAVAWMVSVSAVTAALGAIVFGAVSDRSHSRWGRRKPFILFGLLTAGVLTIVFSFADKIQSTAIAVPYIVVVDSLMMFGFGAAYDGAFGGYVTDITNTGNRARVQSIISIVVGVATVLTSALAGVIIDRFGYPVFFICIGCLMIIAGILGGFMLQDEPVACGEAAVHEKTLIGEILDNFRWSNITKNKDLFLLFLAVVIWGCGWYAVIVYLTIYIMQYLGFTTAQAGLAGAVPMVIGMLAALPIGALSDKLGRKNISIALLILMVFGAIIFSFVKPGVSLPVLMIFLTILMLPLTGFGVCGNAWAKDMFPKGKTAQFAGLSLVFIVTVPMIIGSNIGSFVISKFGTPAIIDGRTGFAPTPLLFWVAAVATVLCIIPVLFMKQDHKKADKSAVQSH